MLFPTRNGKVHVHKILPENFQDVLKVWNQYKRNEVPKSLHFRLKTRGEIDRTNVHPFRVLSHAEHGREVWIMHNGTIGDAPILDKEKSDTWHFVTYILRPILSENPELADNKDFHVLVESMLKGDRMLLLDGATGKTVRLNATNSGGHVTKDGIWVSNNYGLREPYAKKSYGFHGNNYLDDDFSQGNSNTYGSYASRGSSNDYTNVVFKESKATIYSPYRSLLQTTYSRSAKLECMRELKGWLKDGNKNELDFELHISVKNTGSITLNRVGIRLNLSEFLGKDFDDIRITDYKVRGQLTPVQSRVILSNTVYGNNKHADYLNTGASGSVNVKVTAKFTGTKEEFKELAHLPISSLYAEVGYNTPSNQIVPLAKDWIKGKEEDTPPWIEGAVIELPDESVAEKLAKQDDAAWGKDTTFDENLELDDDDGILYHGINSNTQWELDYAMLKDMTDSELIDMIREHPEHVADFIREFLDADII